MTDYTFDESVFMAISALTDAEELFRHNRKDKVLEELNNAKGILEETIEDFEEGEFE